MTSRDIVDRIEMKRKEKHLERKDLYDYANIAYNTFPNWTKKEDSKVPAQALAKIAELLQVSLDWLITGQEAKNDISQKDKELLASYHQLSTDNQSIIQGTMQVMLQNQQGKSAAIVG